MRSLQRGSGHDVFSESGLEGLYRKGRFRQRIGSFLLMDQASSACTLQSVFAPITLTLPWPISANRYWISFYAPKLKRVCVGPSTKAKAYKTEVGWIARAAGIRQALVGPIEVTMQLYPHLPQDWAKRAKADPLWWDLTVQSLDLDNANKVIWDALKGIAFTDDKMIRRSQAEIAWPDGVARVVVTIKPYERAHPQERLFAREPVYVPKAKTEPKLAPAIPKERERF